MAEESPTPGNREPSFEQTLAELEGIVRQLEAGEKPLEESLALYERGVGAYRRCNQILEKAKNRIRLVLLGPDGEVILRESELPREQPQPPQQTAPANPDTRKRKGALEPRAPRQPAPENISAAPSAGINSEEISKQSVDSEPDRPQNPPATLNSRSRSTTPKPAPGGGSLFGSAQ